MTSAIPQELERLKREVHAGRAVIGTERVLKSLRAKALGKIFIASNCPSQTKQDILHYAKIAQIPVVELPQNNEELGLLCKKNFFISVAGMIGE